MKIEKLCAKSVYDPPAYCQAIKVTGALFHTQGGLVVDESARVLPLPNVFAGGGAARGSPARMSGATCPAMGFSPRWPSAGSTGESARLAMS